LDFNFEIIQFASLLRGGGITNPSSVTGVAEFAFSTSYYKSKNSSKARLLSQQMREHLKKSTKF
jgi:hypothetical protein